MCETNIVKIFSVGFMNNRILEELNVRSNIAIDIINALLPFHLSAYFPAHIYFIFFYLAVFFFFLSDLAAFAQP